MTWQQWLVATWMAAGLATGVVRAVRLSKTEGYSAGAVSGVIMLDIGLNVAIVVILSSGGFW